MPEFPAEHEPAGRRTAGGSRRNPRRAPRSRAEQYGAGLDADRSGAGLSGRDPSDGFEEADDRGAELGVPVSGGRRAGAGGRTGLREVVAGATARDRRRPPAKPSRRSASQRKRPRPPRGRLARTEAAEDWPDADWTSVSEEDFWADISSDKPLATTARSTQPATEFEPPGSDPEKPAPAGRRRSRRSRAAGPSFGSAAGAAQAGHGNEQDTTAIPSGTAGEPPAWDVDLPGPDSEPPGRDFTDPDLALLASLGVNPPERPATGDGPETPPEALAGPSAPDIGGSRWSGRAARQGAAAHGWEAGEPPSPADMPAGYEAQRAPGWYGDSNATQAFSIGDPAGNDRPGPETPERGMGSSSLESYPGAGLAGSFPDLGSDHGYSSPESPSAWDSYPRGTYAGSSSGAGSYPDGSNAAPSHWDSYPGGSHGSGSNGSSSYGHGFSGSGTYGSGTYGASSNGIGSHDIGSYGTDAYGTDAYGADSSGADTHGASSYGAGSSADSSGTGSYRPGSYGPDWYETDSHGSGSYGTDAYGAHSYGADSPGAHSYGSDSFAPGSYGAHFTGGDSYRADSYRPGSHGGASGTSASYGDDFYRPGSHGGGSYGGGHRAGDSYPEGAVGSHAHDASTDPGTGSHGAGYHVGGSHDGGHYPNGSYGTGSYQPSHDEPGPEPPPASSPPSSRYTGGYLSSSALSARQPNPSSGGNPYGRYVNGSPGAADGHEGDWPGGPGHPDDPGDPGNGRHRHPPGGKHR